MGKRVDGSLGTLLQGISQQPDKERLAGQVEDQVNMTSDPLRMLHRRPPTQFQAKVAAPVVDPSKIFVHFYSRGDAEEYFIVVYPNDGNPRVLGKDGTEFTASVSASMQSYLDTPNPKANLAATTVGDYTFFTNKTVTISGTNDEPDEWPVNNPSRVTILAEQYSRDYTITVRADTSDGPKYSSATVTTPASTDTDAEENVSASNTLQLLRAALQAVTNFVDYFDMYVDGNESVIIPKATVEKYSVETTDSTGGDAIVAINNNEVTGLADLPLHERAGSVYRISGGTNAADDFYMRFTVNSTAPLSYGGFNFDLAYFQSGIWVEAQFGTAVLDQDTMPHMLIRGDSFDFVGGAGGETVDSVEIDRWADRTSGDKTTNPFPDFVTSSIVDLAVFQGRLVLVYPEGISMSVTRDFFNFFKKTVTALLDDAPIGLASAGVKVNLLRFAQTQDRDLVLFADQAQYTIPGGSAITPQNATMAESTQFVMQTEVRPAPSGQNLFFAVNSGVYSGVREFYTDSDLNSNNARPITVAVERLIVGDIRIMSSSTNISKMVCVGSAGSTAYVYEYLWEDTSRLQSAWSKWEFRDDLYIFHMEFSQQTLSVLSYDNATNEVHVCLMDISQDTTQTYFEGDLMMDHRTEVDGVNLTASGLGHLPADVDKLLAVQGPGCPYPGMLARIIDWDGSTATLKNDMLGGTVLFGMKYESSITPSRIYVRDQGNRAIGTSQLTIGAMFINFIDSGDFNVDVQADYAYTERNSGRILGQVSSTIGDFSLTTGSFEVPVRARNDRSRIRIYNDSPYPFTVSDIEWDGLYYKRGSRITRPS